MNKYKLIYFPNDILTKPTIPIVNFTEELDEIIGYMHKIMLENKGIGLAAPQIGLPISLFIMQQLNGEIMDIFNPKIISQSGHQIYQEGCLSYPGIFVPTSRPTEITFSYQNSKGEMLHGIVEGLEAVIFSHENEHLLGESFLFKTTRPQRRIALKKLGVK